MSCRRKARNDGVARTADCSTPVERRHGKPGRTGVTSHRQPRQGRGAQGPKTVKGAQSDRNYVGLSRLLLDCVPVFHKIITTAYLLYRSGPVAIYYSQRWTRARNSECLPGAQKLVTPLPGSPASTDKRAGRREPS